MRVRRKITQRQLVFAIIGILTLSLPDISFALTGTWTETFTSAGANSWTGPSEVTSVSAECWGAGGAGGAGNSLGSGAGAGGGGGAYAKRAAITVTPASSYTFTVGAGGTGGTGNGPIGATTTFTGDGAVKCEAQGGRGGIAGGAGAGGAGGLFSLSTGDQNFVFSGGTGSTTMTASTLGGGGGSSAGTVATGTSATGQSGATAPAGGGNGGTGGAAGVDGSQGTAPGGGGGGGGQRSGGAENGASGQPGQGKLSYTVNLTRLYLNNAAAPITPTDKGTWTDASFDPSPVLITTTKSGALATSSIFMTGFAQGDTYLFLKAVSPALSSGVTLNNKINLIIPARGRSVTSDCSLWRVHAYVTQGDSTTLVRGTLLSNFADTVTWPTNTTIPTGINISASTTPTSVAAQTGDRIVFELGCSVPAGAAQGQAQMNYGGTGNDIDVGVSGVLGVGYIEFAQTLTFSAAVPGTPGTPSYTNTAATSTGVTWTASSPTADSYKLEQCINGTGTCTLFTGITNNSTTTYGLSGNTTYDYAVKGTNTDGDSAFSATSSRLTLPGIPTSLTSSLVTQTTLRLSWTEPTGGDASSTVARCTGSGCSDFAIVSGSDPDNTDQQFDDSGLSANTTYTYKVLSNNNTGSGLYSATYEVTTSAAASVVSRILRLKGHIRIKGHTRLL